ncbi:MAG: biopolymer transporter ExbD [Elusimicrobia bacterium]|nr:biopolymer transporter ExbD [Elusimicrobiota bacterium]
MHGRFERRRPITEMNLIPLIDVSLILVIIFMVLTPVLVQHQLTVRLPASAQGVPGDNDATVSLQIDARGNITLDGRPVRLEALESELALKVGKAARKTVLVQADKSVAVQRVVQVLDVAKKLGVGKLGLGVQQAER